MSSTLRIKIEYANNGQDDESSLKFVYVIDSPSTTTIDQLITTLQEFFVTQFSCNNMRLIHLVTEDGYLLMKHNICAHVLNNNEKIVCIDMDQFIARNRNTLNFEEPWLRLEQHDASDDIEKNLTIGMNNTGKLYVYLFGGENIQELYMFNILELLDIARDKQKGRILKYTWIHVYTRGNKLISLIEITRNHWKSPEIREITRNHRKSLEIIRNQWKFRTLFLYYSKGKI
jgi:hypothetical protein